MRRNVPTAVLILVTLVACGSGEESPGNRGADLRVERTEEEGITVVRNLAGSEWGDAAELVPELQIGVMDGDPDYMHANPIAFWVEDGEIYVVDSQDSEVRVYGIAGGDFRRRFGRPGQGPGELEGPSGIFVDGDRVFVHDRNKLVVFDRSGEHLDDWNLTEYRFVQGIQLTPTGIHAGIVIPPENPGPGFSSRDATWGYAPVGPEGFAGEPRVVPKIEIDPPTMMMDVGGGRSVEITIPGHAGSVVHDLMPTGDLVYGYPGRYRFNVRRPGGATMAIERDVEPIAYHPAELDEMRRRHVEFQRRRLPDYEWDGAGMPEARPYYFTFLGSQGGTVWVARQGEPRRVEDCTEPEDVEPGVSSVPCWQPERVLDAFSLETGHYLGEVLRPGNEPLTGFLYLDESLLVAGTQDELGTPLVTVFRIVRPSEREET